MTDDPTLDDLFPENAGIPRPAVRRRRTSSADGRARASAHSRRRQRPRVTRHPIRNRILFSVAILLVLPLLAATGAFLLIQQTYSSNVHVLQGNPFPHERAAAGATGAQNILLLGSDTRASALGDITSGTSTGQRSDTMLLVHIPANHRDVEVMSLMRDLWVPIPGHGEGKLNAAFSYGGVPLAVQTIEQLLSTRINHVAVVDFNGFAQMSSALGGVDVQSPKAFTSKNLPGYTFTKGTNHVEGQRALAFVRERYSFPDSDFQRVKDQQSFLAGVVKEVRASTHVSNLGTIREFAATTSRYLTVDKGLSTSEIIRIGYSLRAVRSSDVHFFSLPTDGTGTSADGQSIVNLDRTAVTEIAAALHDDSLSSYVVSHHLTGGD